MLLKETVTMLPVPLSSGASMRMEPADAAATRRFSMCTRLSACGLK